MGPRVPPPGPFLNQDLEAAAGTFPKSSTSSGNAAYAQAHHEEAGDAVDEGGAPATVGQDLGDQGEGDDHRQAIQVVEVVARAEADDHQAKADQRLDQAQAAGDEEGAAVGAVERRLAEPEHQAPQPDKGAIEDEGTGDELVQLDHQRSSPAVVSCSGSTCRCSTAGRSA